MACVFIFSQTGDCFTAIINVQEREVDIHLLFS